MPFLIILAKQEDIRKKLQNKIRRADLEQKVAYQAEKAKVTEVITELRKRKNIAIAIEDRAPRIDTAMEQLAENEDRSRNQVRTNKERSRVR